MLSRFMVGVITSTHGLKGEVKVFPTTDDPERFDDLKSVTVEPEDGVTRTGFPKELEVEHVKYFKGRPIVKFKGLDQIEDVQPMRGMGLYVDRADAVPLEEDEYFIGDLVGSGVFLEDGSQYGILKDILTTAANDVYVITGTDGSEHLLPSVKEFIREVDPENQRIVVRIMKEI